MHTFFDRFRHLIRFRHFFYDQQQKKNISQNFGFSFLSFFVKLKPKTKFSVNKAKQTKFFSKELTLFDRNYYNEKTGKRIQEKIERHF